ncbi:restriction endonuclease subunit S [Mycobacteroides chelonae]
MKCVPLGDVAKIVSGATPKTGVPEFWDGPIPWATPADLSKLDGAYISRTPRNLTESGVRSCATTVLPANSVLLSSRAPIGHVAINTVPMATNQGFKSLVPGPQLDSKFLYHWLRSKTAYLQSLGNGATFKEISKRTTEQIEVLLPTLDEQRRIAAILDHADALRAERRQVQRYWNELVSAVFYRWFGDPVTNEKDWPVYQFGDHIESMQYGPRFHNESYSVDGTRIVRITDLDHSGSLDFDGMPRMSLSDDTKRKFVLSPGDIVFARTGATVGKLTTIRNGDPACVAGAYFIRIQLKEHIEPDFAATLLRSRSIQEIITSGSHQSAQQNFSGPGLRSLPFPLPPPSLQRQFCDFLTSLSSQQTGSARASAKLDALFASLQSRAFRGEL